MGGSKRDIKIVSQIYIYYYGIYKKEQTGGNLCLNRLEE
jgi:hypothetical protein